MKMWTLLLATNLTITCNRIELFLCVKFREYYDVQKQNIIINALPIHFR